MLSLTSNTFGRTHGDHLAELIPGAEEVLLVSPFLFDDFTSWVSSVDFSAVGQLTLVTSLAPRGDNQLRKPRALLSLIEAMRARYPKTRVRIQADDQLHGKIYIAMAGGRAIRGIVTSANLTHSGLQANHEWGVYSEDEVLLGEIRRQVLAAVEHTDITESLLRIMLMFVQSFLNQGPMQPMPDIDVGLKNALKGAPRKTTPAQAIEEGRGSRRIFLKPMGTAEEPLRKQDRESFAATEDILSFPRKPVPSDVQPGDILIAFATGDRSVVSVYRVLRRAEEWSAAEQAQDPHAARWPWYVPGQNLTPLLGGRWWDVDITIDALASKFQAHDRGAALTDAGGPTLGALNHGAGRLKLSQSFGEFAFHELAHIEEAL